MGYIEDLFSLKGRAVAEALSRAGARKLLVGRTVEGQGSVILC